jgi:stage II sporulation protein P
MSPRATLIEVGSHTNDKAQAEETMYLFSEVVNDFIYGTAEGEQASGRAPTTSKGPGGTALRSVLWIVAGLVAAVAIFLLISTGGFEQMKAKLRQFTGREMADITGARDDEGDRSDGGQEGS